MKKVALWLLALCMVLTMTCAMADGVENRPCPETGAAHRFVDQAYDEGEYKAPTCHTAGQKTQYCLDCGERIYVTLPATSTTETKRTEPTCTADGSEVTTCKECGTVLSSKKLDKVDHIPGAKHEIEADCCRSGGYQYLCIMCHNVLEQVVNIYPYGHPVEGVDYKVETKDADCTTDGYIRMICIKYGTLLNEYPLSKWGHSFLVIKTVDPTCTTDGYILEECQNGKCEEIRTTVLPATGHDLDRNNDGKVDKYDYVKYDATCTAEGKYTLECENPNCNYTQLVEVIPMKPHDFVLATAECIPAHCTQEGLKVYYCSMCGMKKLEIVPMIEHSWKTHTHPSTCVEMGWEEVYCEFCQYTKSKIDLPLAPHTVVTDGAVKKFATCTTDGLRDVKCSVYNCQWTDKNVVIPARNHKMSDVRLDAATCLNDGYKYQYCTNTKGNALYLACDHTVILEKYPALGHDKAFDDTKEVAATCYANGYRYWTCNRCNNSGVDTIPTLAHTLVNMVSEPTGSKHGVKTVFCTVTNCNYSKSEEFCQPGVWEITKPATCTEEGEKTRLSCTVPGCKDAKKETEKVAKLAHNEVIDAAVAATCTSTGLTEGKSCADCGEVTVKQTTIAKLAHTESAWTVVTAATCEKAGEQVKTCTACGVEMKKEAIAALAHNEVIDAAVAATCTSTGLTEGKHCATCGEVTVKQTATAKLAHTESTWTIVNAATCEKAGEQVKTCTACGVEMKKEAIAALGHKWKLVGYTAPTSTTEGTRTFACTRCSKSFSDSLAMLARSAVKDVLDIVAEDNENTLVIDLEMFELCKLSNVKGVRYLVDGVTVYIPVAVLTMDADTTFEISVVDGVLTVNAVKADGVIDVTAEAMLLGVEIEK